MTETLCDGFAGFGLSGLDPHSAGSEEDKEPAVPGLDSVDTDKQLSAELGKLIRVVSDIKHHALLHNRYGHGGYFNILNSHPVATGSFFQVRKLDGVESSQPMVAKYPKLQITPTGYGITQSSLQSIRLEIEALCHEPLRKHSNIVKILGMGWGRLSSVHNHFFPALFLEFATHGNLEQYLSDNRIAPAARMRLAMEVGEGLNALHESGIVHGDLKLENVLVFDGGDGTVISKLADFGSTVQLLEDEYRFRGGTRPWNAPEWQQAVEPIRQHLLDIYSFGLLTWRICLEGETPFPGLTLDEIDIRKAQGMTINDAIKSVTEYYDFYNSTVPDISEMEQFELYMVSVICPINVFRNTLIVESSRRNLAEALEGLNPKNSYGIGPPASQKPKSTTGFENVLINTKGRNSYMMLHDAPRLVRAVLIESFISQVQNEDVASKERGELCLQLALANLDGFTGYTNYPRALDWLIKAAEFGCKAAYGIIYRVFSTVGKTKLMSHPGLFARVKDWLIAAASSGYRVALEDLLSLDSESYERALEISRQRFYLDSVSPNEGKMPKENIEAFTDPESITTFPRGIPKVSKASLVLNMKLDTLLHFASAYGIDLDHFEILLSEGPPDLDTQDEDGNTPLLLAMRSGYGEHAKMLLEYGASSIPNKLGQTPCHWMVNILDSQMVQDIAESLDLERKDFEAIATREDLDSEDMYHQVVCEGTPLHWAVIENREDVAECLLRKGANSTFPYKSFSPIDLSVGLCSWRMFKTLARYAEKPISSQVVRPIEGSVGSIHGEPSLNIASDWVTLAMYRYPSHQHMILHGASYQEAFSRTLVELRRAGMFRQNIQQHITSSLRYQSIDMFSALLRYESFQLQQSSVGDLVSAFISTAPYISPEVAYNILVEIANFSPDERSLELIPAVFEYVRSLNADTAVLSLILEIASLIEVDVRDKEGCTPFLWAVRSGNFEVATELLRRGANPDITIPASNSPPTEKPPQVNILHNLLITDDEIAVSALQYLLEPQHPFQDRVPSFVVCEERGMTVLHLATRWGNKTVFDFVWKHFNDPSLVDVRGKVHGETALHIAAIEGRYDIANALVGRGADINAELPRSHRRPLDFCYDTKKYSTNLARTRRYWEDLFIGRLRVYHFLAQRGAEMTKKHPMPIELHFVIHACQGNWPRLLDEALDQLPKSLKTQDCLDDLLFRATSRGYRSIVSRLLKAGSYVNSRSSKGQTPLHLVAALGDVQTARALVMGGADLSIRDEEGRTAAISAFVKGHKGMVSYLLSRGAPNNFPEIQELEFLVTMRDSVTGEEFQEKSIARTCFMKWEDKDADSGAKKWNFNQWIEGLRGGSGSGYLEQLYADREDKEDTLLKELQKHHGEGFHEAWRRF